MEKLISKNVPLHVEWDYQSRSLFYSSAFVLLQNKMLSLNPAKKAVSILRRPFGSETGLSLGSQLSPVENIPVYETNDVSTELQAPATQAVTDTEDEVLL